MPNTTPSKGQQDDVVASKKLTKGTDSPTSSSETTSTTSKINSSSTTDGTTITKRKVLKKVRKNRDKSEDESTNDTSSKPSSSIIRNLGADVLTTLTSSNIYIGLVILRFLLIFITPASLEGIEFSDGVDVLASSLLPGMSLNGTDPLINQPPVGLETGEGFNRTRSIVGAFITSGIPFMGINAFCTKVLNSSCNPNYIGYLALYVPRIWMFFISLVTDYFLARCFAVYEGHNAVHAMITYASTWTTLIGMTRNMNFSLEALCISGLLAASFGWKQNTTRPVFWLSAFCLALGIFLRPPFAFFVFTPIVFLSSLIGKSNIDHLRYLRSAIEGVAVFGFWITIWITVDSVYFGTFKLRFNEIPMTSFNMFLEYCTKGLPFSYKGYLVYTPINAFRTIANRQFFATVTANTSPGQMFLSLPTILGPLFIVLIRESYEGMKLAMKELMAELKQAANSGSGSSSKKSKKKKSKKNSGITKDIEDELYTYFDTIQTTFLLGLLIEVVQNHERLGTLSLISLIPPCIICIAGRVFGPEAFPKFKSFHIAFSVGMVILYGFLNQSGIPKLLLRVGSDSNMDLIPNNSDLVVYRGVVGHRYLLGPNIRNVSVHSGGDSTFDLMIKLRAIKNVEGYNISNLFVLAAATVKMKESDFEFVGTGAYGHMSISDLPDNLDDAVRKSRLQIYRFIGDEDEVIIRDNEEAEEAEEMEREARLGNDKKQDVSHEDEL